MRKPPALAALVVGTALALAACGGDDASDGTNDATGANGVTASGEFGDKPEVIVAAGDPSDELVVEVLSEGDGPEIVAGDLLVVNYLGQAWDLRDPADLPPDPMADPDEAGDEAESGDPVPFVFDNSYDRGEPASFEIGVGMVIPGWDEGLVGQNVGSRVMLTIPPDLGYGNAEGHDLEEETLVFVVDVIGAFNTDRAISGDAVEGLGDDLPEVSGDGVDEPTVEFGAAGDSVTESTSDLLVAGDGPELGDNLVVKVLTADVESGEVAYSSWQLDRLEVITPMDLPSIPGLAEALEGQNEGSRVLTRIAAADNPGQDGSEGEPIVFVIDVVGSY